MTLSSVPARAVQALVATWLLSNGWACTGERWTIQAEPTPDAGSDAAVEEQPLTCPSQAPSPPVSAEIETEPIHRGRWHAALTDLPEQDRAALPNGPLLLNISANDIQLQFGGGDLEPPTPETGTGYLCPTLGPSTCAPPSGLLDEHAYHAVEGFARNAILHLRFSQNEPWQAWCELQLPQPIASIMGCPPNYAIETPYSSPRWGATCSIEREGQTAPIDCSRLTTLELNPCRCNATECWAALTRRIELNLRWSEQDQMHGTFWYGANRAVELQLVRQSVSP